LHNECIAYVLVQDYYYWTISGWPGPGSPVDSLLACLDGRQCIWLAAAGE
jgi:hypothetical protein